MVENNNLKEEQIERLKKKYEYLFIEDEELYDVLDQIIDDIILKNNGFDITTASEIEDKFIYNVIKKINNGDDNLIDALSESFKFINDLVIKKMSFKLNNISKEELEILYDDVINDLIKNYKCDEKISTLIVKKLKEKYINYANGDKNKSKIKEGNTIYSYFEYPKQLIDCVWIGINVDIKQLFIKKWGRNLDGGKPSILKKNEEKKFNDAISIFKKTLDKAFELNKKGKTYDEISLIIRSNRNNPNFLNKEIIENSNQKKKQKSNNTLLREEIMKINVKPEEIKEIEINVKPIAIIKKMPLKQVTQSHYEKMTGLTLDNETKRESKKVKKYKNIGELVEAHHATIEEIEDAVEFLPVDMKIAYTDFYGIGHSKIAEETIIDNLKISKYLFKSYLINADEMIDKFINKNRKAIKENSQTPNISLKKEQVLIKPLTPTKIKVKTLNDIKSEIIKKITEDELSYINELPISDIEKTIIYLKIKYINQENSDALISSMLKIDIRKLIECYINNLLAFKDNEDKIIFEIVNKHSDACQTLLSNNNFNNLINKLAVKQKLYLYLKLQSITLKSNGEIPLKTDSPNNTIINEIEKIFIKQ